MPGDGQHEIQPRPGWRYVVVCRPCWFTEVEGGYPPMAKPLPPPPEAPPPVFVHELLDRLREVTGILGPCAVCGHTYEAHFYGNRDHLFTAIEKP